MVTVLEGMPAVYSQGVFSNVRLGAVDKILVRRTTGRMWIVDD